MNTSSKKQRILYRCVYFLPLLLGTLGYVLYEHYPWNEAVFNSVLFYFLNNGNPATNLLTEIARWTAPVVTASWVLSFLFRVRESISNALKYHRGDAVAVTGDGEDARILVRQLGARGIWLQDRFAKAQHYILTGAEADNDAWLREHKDQVPKEALIYVKTAFPSQRRTSGNLLPYSEVQTAARLYWKERFLYPDLTAAGNSARENAGAIDGAKLSADVVFLDFGELSQELLLAALQNNIFSVNQEIRYHVFGDAEAFLGIYHEIERIKDPVIVHAEPWYQSMDLLRAADRVILCEDTDRAVQVLFADPQIRLDLLVSDDYAVQMMEERDRVTVFPWRERALVPSHILQEDLLYLAKRINLEYAVLYASEEAPVERNAKCMEAEWQKLNTFLKFSNIGSADYHEMQTAMLQADGRSGAEAMQDEAQVLRLARLEHERWCRFHYLNNWRYGQPANGRRKDASLRLHQDLVSWEDMPAGEEEKDFSNIRLLFSLDEKKRIES